MFKSAAYLQASSYISTSANFLQIMSPANTQLLSLLQSMFPPPHLIIGATALSQFVF